MKTVLAMMMAVLAMVGCRAAKPEDVARQYVQALQASDPVAFKALLDKNWPVETGTIYPLSQWENKI